MTPPPTTHRSAPQWLLSVQILTEETREETVAGTGSIRLIDPKSRNPESSVPLALDADTDAHALDWDTRRVYIAVVTKKLIRHGNSAALVLDKALLDLLKVQIDTPLEVTTDGRNIIISPQADEQAEATLLEALERINQKHGSVLAKLAK